MLIGRKAQYMGTGADRCLHVAVGDTKIFRITSVFSVKKRH